MTKATHGAFPAEHCSYWCGIDQSKLNDANRLHIEILCRIFNTGVWNLKVNWEKVDWRYGGDNSTRFVVQTEGLSTFDFDHLTRLVVLAHAKGVRIDVAPKAFKYLAITMFSGRGREGPIHARHPEIEEAIAAIKTGD